MEVPTTARERIRIDNESHAFSSGHGAVTILVGSLVAAAGIVPLRRALAHGAAGHVDESVRIVGWMCTVFIVGGLLTIVVGVAGVSRKLRAARRRREHQDRPELWDHDWDPERVSDGSLRRSLQRLAISGCFVGFLGPIVWWALSSGNLPAIFAVLLGGFGLIAIVDAGLAVLRLVRTIRFGESHLRLPHFPLRLGERIELQLEVAGGLSLPQRVECQLRFVEEVWELSGRANQRSDQQRVRYALWQSECEIETPGFIEGSGGTIAVPIQLPADEPELLTDMSGKPARYWELDIRVVRTGFDYVGSFQLPVYGIVESSESAVTQSAVCSGDPSGG